MFGQWVETGRASGGLALANLLYGHEDRLASHLFSPTDLRFSVDYENLYAKPFPEMGTVAARVVSREWEAKNIDLLFGHGVKCALDYGAYFLKQLAGKAADGSFYSRGAQLVPPWMFGVYDEGVNDLNEQEALCETVWLNRHQVWRRVRNLPDAEKRYKRILASANKDDRAGIPRTFMHQVLSTAILDVSLRNMTNPMPGGIVQLSNDASTIVSLGPEISVDLFPRHEVFVKDDARGGEDYTTIQMIEPDILVAPLFKHSNLFVPGRHPWTLIQANFVHGYPWGRSEITDLMMLQEWLTTHLDDLRRVVGLQIDKILAFPGYDGITDELYGKFRTSGYIGLPPGADVKDLTPAIPPELIPLITEIIGLMDRTSGFPPIMSGQGEPGVRAGVHADTLMKTGSPRLRDRSLLVERQAAQAADDTLAILEAKQAQAYWIDANDEKTDFLLSQLPDDRRISVDSHSSSPIYHDDHAQLVAWGVKSGVLGPDDAIDDLPFAHKDRKLQRLHERPQAHQQQLQKLEQEDPAAFARAIGAPGAGRSRPRAA